MSVPACIHQLYHQTLLKHTIRTYASTTAPPSRKAEFAGDIALAYLVLASTRRGKEAGQGTEEETLVHFIIKDSAAGRAAWVARLSLSR
jgi:hypothetical protein